MVVKIVSIPCQHNECVEALAHSGFVVWCPSWFDADEGPKAFCKKHSAAYHPDANLLGRKTLIFWNQDAYDAYIECGVIVRRKDERYSSIKKMCENGKRLDWHTPESIVCPSGWYCVNGQVWLITDLGAVNTGDYDISKCRYGFNCDCPHCQRDHYFHKNPN